MKRQQPLGIVAALLPETRALTRRRAPLMNHVRLTSSVLLVRSGMGPKRAARAARILLAQDVGALVSWGTAGGLDPELVPGDVLVPERVINAEGVAYNTDRGWRAALAARLQGHTRLHGGMLVSQSSAAAQRRDKTRLFEKTQARALDMESAAVGEVAARAGVAFLVIRVIADPAATSLSKTALNAVDAGGRLQLGALVNNLRRRPGDVVELFQLARHFKAARAALAQVARVGGTQLACPLLG